VALGVGGVRDVGEHHARFRVGLGGEVELLEGPVAVQEVDVDLEGQGQGLQHQRLFPEDEVQVRVRAGGVVGFELVGQVGADAVLEVRLKADGVLEQVCGDLTGPEHGAGEDGVDAVLAVQ
jgi:hypothetical protein